MTASILKTHKQEVKLWDINTLMFHDTFTGRRYWKHFLLDADSGTIEDFQQQTKEFFVHYANKILSDNPEVIIFKCIGKTYANSIRLAQIIKEKDKDKLIILCGLLLTVEQDVELFVARQKEIPADFIICGEDDFALSELIKAIEINGLKKLGSIFKKNDKVINCINGPIVDNLDNLPFFEFSDFDLNSYRFPDTLEIFMSKGCPWRCVFCIDWRNEKYRSMSGKRIFDELLYQTNLYKQIRHFRFCDKTINGNIRALTEFCNLVSEGFKQGLFQRNDWYWSGDAMIRPEMNRELLEKMVKARCNGIGYGIESGSEKVVKDMGKFFSIPLAEEVIKNTHSNNLKTTINILVGFPTETRKDFEETMKFIVKNRDFIDEVRLTYGGCRVYPHSYLDTDLDKYNITYPVSEVKELNSIDSWINKVDYWMSEDGLNTYEERIRRTEEISELILSLGIELRVNSRITRKSKVNRDA